MPGFVTITSLFSMESRMGSRVSSQSDSRIGMPSLTATDSYFEIESLEAFTRMIPFPIP